VLYFHDLVSFQTWQLPPTSHETRLLASHCRVDDGQERHQGTAGDGSGGPDGEAPGIAQFGKGKVGNAEAKKPYDGSSYYDYLGKRKKLAEDLLDCHSFFPVVVST
jgi:hypothetical protein